MGYRGWFGLWPLAIGLLATIAFGTAFALGVWRGSTAWAGAWWPWLALARGLAALGLAAAAGHAAGAADRLQHARTGNRTHVAGRLAAGAGRGRRGSRLSPGSRSPAASRSDDRYELFGKPAGRAVGGGLCRAWW